MNPPIPFCTKHRIVCRFQPSFPCRSKAIPTAYHVTLFCLFQISRSTRRFTPFKVLKRGRDQFVQIHCFSLGAATWIASVLFLDARDQTQPDTRKFRSKLWDLKRKRGFGNSSQPHSSSVVGVSLALLPVLCSCVTAAISSSYVSNPS
jgi:hypothetical protein